jgi:hypothetical protein
VAAFSPAEFLRTAWLLVGTHAMRPIAGRRSAGGHFLTGGARHNWDSNAVLTQHAKILTRIQGGRTANFGARALFLGSRARRDWNCQLLFPLQ